MKTNSENFFAHTIFTKIAKMTTTIIRIIMKTEEHFQILIPLINCDHCKTEKMCFVLSKERTGWNKRPRGGNRHFNKINDLLQVANQQYTAFSRMIEESVTTLNQVVRAFERAGRCSAYYVQKNQKDRDDVLSVA
jgi:hypothetical protein